MKWMIDRLSAAQVWVVLAALWFGAVGPAQAQVQVRDARVWPAPDHVRFVLDLGAATRYSVFTLDNPHRVVIDLTDARLAKRLDKIDLGSGPIKGIRTAVRNDKDIRIVLDLSQPIKTNSFTLEPNDQYGHRLVVDLLGAGGKAAAKADVASTSKITANTQSKPATNTRDTAKAADAKPVRDSADDGRRNIVVVIDPGHGGDDPGAIGPSGVREKEVVLAIARELQTLISQQRGFTARLTRTGDYFIPLRQRTNLARKHGADLFVSVHADAFTNPQARGASIYTLSHRGATSETARWLAQSENRSDLVGGAGGVSLDDKDDNLAKVLLDLSMTKSMEHSIDIGNVMLSRLGRVGTLHKSRVEQAGFMVLKSPDIPSLLVETGFISHPGEEKQLSSKAHQKKVARAMFDGIMKYFNDMPPHGTLLAYEKRQGGRATAVASADTGAASQRYRVQSGDTLSGIAVRNQTTVSRLMEENGLSNEVVRIGQVIRIPAS